MKNLFALLGILFLSGTSAVAQSTDKIKDASVLLTWLGIDFSQLQFIGNAAQWGDAGEISNAQLVNKYFPGWNELIIKEQEKYDVAKATYRKTINHSIDAVTKANSKLGKRNFFSDDDSKFNRLSEADIKRVVSKYQFGNNKGLGLMFIVESMSKNKEASSIWVTFIDQGTKSVILTKRMEAKSGGMGFRNYWAGSFNKALKTMRSELKKW